MFRLDDSREIRKNERIGTCAPVIFHGGAQNKSSRWWTLHLLGVCLCRTKQPKHARLPRRLCVFCASTFDKFVLVVVVVAFVFVVVVASEVLALVSDARNEDGDNKEAERCAGDVPGLPTINSSGPAGDVIIFMTFRFKSNALLNRTSLCASSNLQRYFTERPAIARLHAHVIPNNSMTSG